MEQYRMSIPGQWEALLFPAPPADFFYLVSPACLRYFPLLWSKLGCWQVRERKYRGHTPGWGLGLEVAEIISALILSEWTWKRGWTWTARKTGEMVSQEPGQWGAWIWGEASSPPAFRLCWNMSKYFLNVLYQMKKMIDSPNNFSSFVLLFRKKHLQPLPLITDELLLKMLPS